MLGAVTVNVVLQPAADHPELLAAPTAKALAEHAAVLPLPEIQVGAIDPALADTAAFCAEYGVGLDESANCVVVAAKRAGQTTYAACLVLGARKISFAPMDETVELTGMEYGGITPVGLPADWPILIDEAVAAAPRVVVGSGIRGSKLWLPGSALSLLPGAVVLPGLGTVPGARAAQ
jgi:prolyl-tRNA editing enzyme YbaK/EbsC (Cys-tRNA(Pro) deacylase)